MASSPSSSFLYPLLHQYVRHMASSPLPCTFLLLPSLLLLALAPSPSYTHTFPLTNPHLLHTSQPSYIRSSPFTEAHRHSGTQHDTLVLNPAPSQEEASPLLLQDGEELRSAQTPKDDPVEAAHPGTNKVLHDNVAQGEQAFHVDGGRGPREELSMPMTIPSHIPEVVGASIDFSTKSTSLHGNARQGNAHGSLVDGQERQPRGLLNPSSSDTHILHDSVRQEESRFPRDDDGMSGGEKTLLPHELPVTRKAPCIGRAEQCENGVPLDSRQHLKDNVAQGDYAFLVDDGGNHFAAPSSVPQTKMQNNPLLRNNVPQEEFSYLLSDGSTKSKQVPGNAAQDSLGLTPSVHGGNGIEILRISTNDPLNNKMVQSGGGHGDKVPLGWRQAAPTRGITGRSRTCTFNPNVCQQMAEEDQLSHTQFIALYGQAAPPRSTTRRPACCSSACVDLHTHLSNCGSCGKQCGLSETCCNGRCTDLNTDSSNCGRCGNSCPVSSPCQYGMCGYY